MVALFDRPNFFYYSPCCPQETIREKFTFWPRPKQCNGLLPEDTFELALQWFQTRFKIKGFNYKVSKKT